MKKVDKLIVWMSVITAVVFLLGVINAVSKRVFAEADAKADQATEVTTAKYVTFYDDGRKLTVKTDAATVGEALERTDILLNNGDLVEPNLATAIDADNFFINIYRAHPVIVRDGAREKYLMTASYDYKTVMQEAGIVVYDGDEIEVKPSQNFLESGVMSVYELVRNGGREVTIEEEIAFDEQTIKDYNLAPGTQEVRQHGELGVKKLVYNVQYIDGVEITRELISETVTKEPVARIVAIGASAIERSPLTMSKGRNRYTVTLSDGRMVERQETYYDLPMSGVMAACGGGTYTVRADGVKVDQDGYVLVAANLSRYPRCSIVETSLGMGKVYDTGGFAVTNPEQFDLATDWTNRDGR